LAKNVVKKKASVIDTRVSLKMYLIHVSHCKYELIVCYRCI